MHMVYAMHRDWIFIPSAGTFGKMNLVHAVVTKLILSKQVKIMAGPLSHMVLNMVAVRSVRPSSKKQVWNNPSIIGIPSSLQVVWHFIKEMLYLSGRTIYL